MSMCVYLYEWMPEMWGWLWKALVLLELELQEDVSHLIWVRVAEGTQSSEQVFFTAELSLQPLV